MCLIELHPGQGGADAEQFAADLAGSVRAWARLNGVVVTEDQQARKYKKSRLVTLSLPGCPPGRVSWLAGTHRIQHVPGRRSRGASGARQTSYVKLVVLGDAGTPPPLVLTAQSPGIRVETRRGTGPGGQHRNTSDTAVTVTHLPTGLTATRDTRSQSANLAAALAELAARITARQAEAAGAARNDSRRAQAAPAVVWNHSAFLDQVKHEPTGARWTRRQWEQGLFAEPAGVPCN